jgi:high-affinity Fe2+/Pb2+ permease
MHEEDGLNIKIKKISTHTVIFILVSSLVLGFEICSLIFKLKSGINTTYYEVCGIMISLGLLLTSLVSLKDWNNYINDIINKML